MLTVPLLAVPQSRKTTSRIGAPHRCRAVPPYSGRWPFIGSNDSQVGLRWQVLAGVTVANSPGKVPNAQSRSRDGLRSSIRLNPLQSIVMAAGLGFIVALIMR
jgi:hypothetical protein